MTIPARDLRNHYGRIIDRVRSGESLTVVSDGLPVMDLVPHVDGGAPQFRPATDELNWAPISVDLQQSWATEIRLGMSDFDDDLRDPWS